MTNGPVGPRTVEEAQALPEIQPHERWSVPLGGLPLSGDDIAMFSDTDGRHMQVVCHGTQWMKCEFRL